MVEANECGNQILLLGESDYAHFQKSKQYSILIISFRSRCIAFSTKVEF